MITRVWGNLAPHLGHRVEAAQPGHADVQQRDVRMMTPGERERLRAGAGLGDDLDPGEP